MDLLGRFKKTYGALKPAEQLLLDSFHVGRFAEIGTVRPQMAEADNVIRSEFIRCLLLMYSPSSNFGESLYIRGAFIDGVLDLSHLSIKTPIWFEKCHFSNSVFFRGARLEHSLTFKQCAIKSFFGEKILVDGTLAFIEVQTGGIVNIASARISADLNCEGSQMDGLGKEALFAPLADIRTGVYLSKGFSADGAIVFRSAKVGGPFNCHSGSFRVESGESINLDSAVIDGSVFLREGFSSIGTVRMLGIRILGQLSCINGRFEGLGNDYAITIERGFIRANALLSTGCEIAGYLDLLGSVIEGNLELDGACIEEIRANEMQVKGRLSLRGLKLAPRTLSLMGAKASFLNDDLSSWGENPILNGFIYDSIDVQKTMPVSERMAWLKKQKASYQKSYALVLPAEHFRSQPWRQLQHVLESMGRMEEAREIGIEFERCLRKFKLIGQTPGSWFGWYRTLYAWWARCLHTCYGYLTGFGYRPMLLLPWFALVWFLCTIIYWGAANTGGTFAPSNPLVFQNEAYETCRPDREQVWLKKHKDRKAAEPPVEFRGGGNWYLCDALREEYTGFSPIAFSLDLLLPLVDLHQENDWAPLIETPKANVWDELKGFASVKRLVRFVMWCEILAGWGFSLLFVAVVSGLTRRKE